MSSGSPTILWLIRSGETAWQREQRVQGRTDLPLSTEGRTALASDLAQLGGAGLPTPQGSPEQEHGQRPAGLLTGKPSLIHHAADEAAKESAAMVARQFGARTKANADFDEPDLGLLSGLTMEHFEERFPTRFRQWEEEPLSLVPPEGEAMEDARTRVLDALGRLARRHRHEVFGLVLHPIALALVRAALEGRPGRELWNMLAARPRVERFLLPDDAEQQLVG